MKVKTGRAGANARTESGGRPPRHRPGRRGRLRLSRRGRRIRTGIAVLLLVGLTWLGFSIGGALTAPGTDSTAARLAEWGRTHHLGWAVTTLEQKQYAMNKPATGGSVVGGVPTVHPVDPAGGSSTGSTTQRGPRLAAPPAPIRPLAPSRLAREGQWQALFGVGKHTAARVAFLRPDTTHTSYLVDVVWMDPSLLRFKLFPGYQVPGPPMTAPDQLLGADAKSVLATFNSGFQMGDSHGGYWQNGRTIKRLRSGAASMVLSKDGHLSVKAWPGGPPGHQVVAVRQNLSLLIQGGKISPLVSSANTKTWGVTVGNKDFVWRTGIGVRADGSIVFVVGPALNVQTLATILQRAGAINAMELDINPEWTNYLTYTHTTSGGAVPHRLGTDTMPSLVRYLQPSSRDFVGVFAR
ncbi:phosphodiester glycosidase family protein [Leekyejoonella antrihumi]|uniref:phosphodiester glycosidase family protein n=1 Tax=Leekyejoonella antrihumi TaxID=1660198 RepID=UPI0016442009|nr:phosphodiester glycosidase family protein [Leekyejoonella antrihumi]